jgi:putative membrane protein
MLLTRAPLIVDVAYAVTLAAPLFVFQGIRLARRKNYLGHRRLHAWLLAIAVIAVLALEIEIRIAGGTGALLRGSAFAGTTLLSTIAIVHIGGAILTYVLWIWLFWASWRKFPREIPGRFSLIHRRLGMGVMAGLIFTAVSATAVYVMGFVL